MSEQPVASILVKIHLRRCTRCGHLECPCCQDFCDDVECIEADEDLEGHCGDLACTYDEPPDLAGYEALERAEAKVGLPCGLKSVDGGILVLSDDDDEPAESALRRGEFDVEEPAEAPAVDTLEDED